MIIWTELKFESWEKTAKDFGIVNPQKLKEMIEERIKSDGGAVLYREGGQRYGKKMIFTKEMIWGQIAS